MWTIDYNGTEKSLEQWGLCAMRRRDAAQTVDQVSFRADRARADAYAVFPYGAWLSIYRNRTLSNGVYSGGNRWFYGLVVKTPRSGTAQSESLSYQLVGPWHYFERNIFEQDWLMWNGTANVNIKNSHIFLNVKLVDGALEYATTSEQIAEAVNHAIALGAPVQLGTLPTGITVPVDEVREIAIAEVIRKQLRWHPDAVPWFDYSTTPPTFHIAQRTALPAASFTIATRPLSEFTVDRRDDLVVPAVCLKYEILSESDGEQHLSVLTDYWPTNATGNQLNTFKSTIDLRGFSSNSVSAAIETAAIDLANIAWWQSHVAHLVSTNTRISNLKLISNSGRALPAADYPRELTRGQMADWMGYTAAKEKVTAVVEYTSEDLETGGKHTVRQNLSANIIATDAPAGAHTYSTLATFTDGDPVPSGIAKALYDALSAVQYSGAIKLGEVEVDTAMRALGLTDRNGLGLVVNLTGGSDAGAEWATMRAMVQQMDQDVDLGETVLTFGPPTHLGIRDLIALLQVTRRRMIYTNPAARGGTLSGGSTVQLGKDVAATNTDGGGLTSSYQKIADAGAGYITTDPKTGDTKTATHEMGYGTTKAVRTVTADAARSKMTAGDAVLDLNTADCAGWDKVKRELKVREVDFCKDGVLMKILGVFSEPYDAPPPTT
jgi:hypothetical protein